MTAPVPNHPLWLVNRPKRWSFLAQVYDMDGLELPEYTFPISPFSGDNACYHDPMSKAVVGQVSGYVYGHIASEFNFLLQGGWTELRSGPDVPHYTENPDYPISSCFVKPDPDGTALLLRPDSNLLSLHRMIAMSRILYMLRGRVEMHQMGDLVSGVIAHLCNTPGPFMANLLNKFSDLTRVVHTDPEITVKLFQNRPDFANWAEYHENKIGPSSERALQLARYIAEFTDAWEMYSYFTQTEIDIMKTLGYPMLMYLDGPGRGWTPDPNDFVRPRKVRRRYDLD